MRSMATKLSRVFDRDLVNQDSPDERVTIFTVNPTLHALPCRLRKQREILVSHGRKGRDLLPI